MRGIIALVFAAITIICSVQIMLNSSIAVGFGALAATALSFFGFATFVGSFLARKEKKYRAIDLVGIGAIAAVLIAVGFALAWWSSFRIMLFGYTLNSYSWLIVGIIAAAVVTRKKDAL